MMRALFFVLFLAGCGEQVAANDCEAAQSIFQSCGVTLPLLSQDTCSGPSRAIAECVLDGESTCEALSRLDVDDCLQRVTEDER